MISCSSRVLPLLPSELFSGRQPSVSVGPVSADRIDMCRAGEAMCSVSCGCRSFVSCSTSVDTVCCPCAWGNIVHCTEKRFRNAIFLRKKQLFLKKTCFSTKNTFEFRCISCIIYARNI